MPATVVTHHRWSIKESAIRSSPVPRLPETRSTDRLCHAQAIAGRGSTVAREKLLGRRGNVRADHIQVGLETAVGDDDGWCIEFGGAFGLVRLNLDSARSKL